MPTTGQNGCGAGVVWRFAVFPRIFRFYHGVFAFSPLLLWKRGSGLPPEGRESQFRQDACNRLCGGGSYVKTGRSEVFHAPTMPLTRK